MKKAAITLLLFGIFSILTTQFFTSCNDAPKTSTITPEVSAVLPSDCNCETNWFPHSQTPAPAEGDGSPFDVSSTTNCIFHQWSWQKFLWLTKPLASGNPLFRDSMTQVDNHLEPVAPVGGVSLILEDSTQAGSAGILVSNPTFGTDNKGHVVYYAIYANPTLQKAAKDFGDRMIKDPTLVNNTFTFPVGALELKTSWIDVSALPASEVASYYTTSAVLVPSGKKITAALLGMHVVGVVKNHPEFIWATFEHHDMAPAYNWAATTTTDVPVTSDVNQLFFEKGVTATYKNVQYTTETSENIFTVNKYGIPRIAGDKFMAVSQSEPVNYTNITGLNTCVAANLKDVWNNYFYNGSLWINTDGLTAQQQADTIVALGYGIGSAVPGKIARGCTAAFNLTMETFMQTSTPMTQMTAGGLTNCLSCHSSPAGITMNGTNYPGNSPLYLSHIFRSYLSKTTGAPKSAIEVLRTKDFIQMLEVKKTMDK